MYFFFLKQLIFILFCFLISFTNIVRFLSTAYAQTNLLLYLSTLYYKFNEKLIY